VREGANTTISGGFGGTIGGEGNTEWRWLGRGQEGARPPYEELRVARKSITNPPRQESSTYFWFGGEPSRRKNHSGT